MARDVVEQPNGEFAIWSTVVDGFVAYNCTREEVIREIYFEDTRQIDEARAEQEFAIPGSDEASSLDHYIELVQATLDAKVARLFDPDFARNLRVGFEEGINTHACHHGADSANIILRGIGLPERDFTRVIAEWDRKREEH